MGKPYQRVQSISCPKCKHIINFGRNKGDWTTFICLKCMTLFSVANSDLVLISPTLKVIKKGKFNPSRR